MDAIDRSYNIHWAIASLGGGGFLVSENLFDLVNLDTGRAHGATLTHGGISAGIGSPAGASPAEYTEFRTRRPANFESFDWAGASISGIGFSVIWGVSYSILSLWEGAAFGPNMLAEVHIADSGFGMGGHITPISNGVFNVIFGGSGKPMGDPRLHLHIEDKVARSIPPTPRYRSAPKEEPLMIAGDVLFDFDRATIKAAAAKALGQVAEIIRRRRPARITISGHTDIVGNYEYNMKLSLRRARAVYDWMIGHDVPGVRGAMLLGYGSNIPVASNQTREGRQKNRRVEFVFE